MFLNLLAVIACLHADEVRPTHTTHIASHAISLFVMSCRARASTGARAADLNAVLVGRAKLTLRFEQAHCSRIVEMLYSSAMLALHVTRTAGGRRMTRD